MSQLLKQETKENIRNTFKESFLILLYECIGTAMMATLVGNYMFQISVGNATEDNAEVPTPEEVARRLLQDVDPVDNGEETAQQVDPKSQYFAAMNMADNTGLLLGMFVTIMFSARISGSHFNPTITLSYMVGNVKQGKFDRILGFLYIVAQVFGAFLGIMLSDFFAGGLNARVEIGVEPGDMIQAAIVEVMGSFFLVFMYLTSTEEKTKFTKDSAVQTMILAGSYLGAMLLAGAKSSKLHASPVNPAIALWLIFFNLKGGNNFSSIWIFCGVNLAGSILALIFFKFVYQKTTEAIDEIEEEENNTEEALMDEED